MSKKIKYIEPLGLHTDSACIWNSIIIEKLLLAFNFTHNSVTLMIVCDALRLIVTRHTLALRNLYSEIDIMES